MNAGIFFVYEDKVVFQIDFPGIDNIPRNIKPDTFLHFAPEHKYRFILRFRFINKTGYQQVKYRNPKEQRLLHILQKLFF
jgi:hypothetical protein